MTTVDSRSASVNEASTSTMPSEDSHFDARNKALEASAVVTALAEALLAHPRGSFPEQLLALAVVCDRICKESVAAADLALAAESPRG